ncbi:uncharacterized protein SCDLUD_000172 [Saccharomycodes ludwigii]|uniref:uncharacterized protein n=1 Tax=Saccharomycodes ludwigii TaxID=36035 RepID=UPI001E83F6F7|nr:hypothetical protein SCDLUD_000172 [Saccharomycodes ludwigii]KAH3902592.1 hypothetical protein SCDLUD_000172 [Saccharomycodes ludwigii]
MTMTHNESLIVKLIIKITTILNESIYFEPHLIHKNNDDTDSNITSVKYIFPIMISDQLKINGGCLPLEVYKIYEKTCHVSTNTTVDKMVYVNREISIFEFKRLVYVLSFCYQIVYDCMLYYDIPTKKHQIFQKKFYHQYLSLSENRFSIIFKNFVGITFKEYNFYVFKFIKKNYEILKPFISAMQNNDYDASIDLNSNFVMIEYIKWKGLARELLVEWSNSNKISSSSNISTTYNTTNKIIMLPFTYTLTNSTNLYHNNCKQNTPIRKKILINRIPDLKQISDNTTYINKLLVHFEKCNINEDMGLAYNFFKAEIGQFDVTTNLTASCYTNTTYNDYFGINNALISKDKEEKDHNTVNYADGEHILTNFQLGYRDFCNFNGAPRLLKHTYLANDHFMHNYCRENMNDTCALSNIPGIVIIDRLNIDSNTDTNTIGGKTTLINKVKKKGNAGIPRITSSSIRKLPDLIYKNTIEGTLKLDDDKKREGGGEMHTIVKILMNTTV